MANTRRKLGIIMDPIAAISPKKDSSFAMLLEASRRDYELFYFEQSDLKMENGAPSGRARRLTVRDDLGDWFTFGDDEHIPLGELDVILMRKDPPFDMEYIYTTYLLDRAALLGSCVVNAPAALRDMNEKVYTAWFPELTPTTLITRSMSNMRDFLKQHQRIVVKPLDGMGGRSIFVVGASDNNANVIFETLTDNGNRFAMAQEFIPEISEGDKRILLVDGVPIPFALARIPPPDDNRGNLVMGATAKVQPLTDRDLEICAAVGPKLKEGGVVFAGIDVIGDCMTEVNVTSPTGIRELERASGLNIAGQMFDAIDERLA